MANPYESTGQLPKSDSVGSWQGVAGQEWEYVFQAIGHPSFILKPDHTIIACNKAAESLTGKSAKELIGKKCWNILHVKNAPPENCPMEKLLKSGLFETYEMEMEALGKSFLVSCTPVFSESGVLDKIIHIATDITEQKRTKEMLRKEGERAQKYLDIAAVMFLVLDAKGTITLINKRGCEILGGDETRILGKNWFESFVPERMRDKIQGVFEQLMAGKIEPVEYFENPVLRCDARERIIAWHNQILTDDAGNITGTVSSGEDITERKLAEKQLLYYQGRLKALVAEMSLAEERERMRIATGLHDDIAQKIVMSKFRLQSLKESLSDSNMKRTLDRECILMGDILDDIRSLTFELSDIPLKEISFESALKSWLKTEIQEKAGLKCEFSLGIDKTHLDEDIKVILFKAVRELLINIIKHARAKTVRVGITSHDAKIEVTVQDDGVGFDVGKLGLPSGDKGGFGLFSIRERLEYIGGHFEIESSPEKGTRIVIESPTALKTKTATNNPEKAF
jgi:PAS domain S-box-containing protein